MARTKKPKPKPLPKWTIKKTWQWLEEIGGPYQSKFLKQISQIRAMARVEDTTLRKAIAKYDKQRQPTKKQLAEEAKKVAIGTSTTFESLKSTSPPPRAISAPPGQPNTSINASSYATTIPPVVAGISPVARANGPGAMMFTGGLYG